MVDLGIYVIRSACKNDSVLILFFHAHLYVLVQIQRVVFYDRDDVVHASRHVNAENHVHIVMVKVMFVFNVVPYSVLLNNKKYVLNVVVKVKSLLTNVQIVTDKVISINART